MGWARLYRAVRADDVLDQQVAIKVLKRGKDSAEVVRRFGRERQTLARLEHPAIARFIDAGAAEDGLPYLVMEFCGWAAAGSLLRLAATDHARAAEACFAKCAGAIHYAPSEPGGAPGPEAEQHPGNR